MLSRLPRLAMLAVLVLASSGSHSLARPTAPSGEPAALTVVVEFEARDLRGRPITDLTAAEVEIVHGAEKQKAGHLEAGDAPGRYVLSYVPLSGQSAAVYLRSLRSNTRILGPGGGALKPRIVAGPTPDELARSAELEDALRRAPRDIEFNVGIFRFEPAPDGRHHTVAVEIALANLLPDPSVGLEHGRLRILARVVGEGPAGTRWLSFDQPLDLPPGSVQHLVWTGDMHLPPGSYGLDVLVEEASTGRAGVSTMPIEVPEPVASLAMSDVVLLHPFDVLTARTGGDDDPLFLGETPLMPNLGVALPIGTGAKVRFFVVLYPEPIPDAAPSLELELLRGTTRVGATSLSLPPPDERGQIRYVGELATTTFRPLEYTLRLVAHQGETTTSGEASFQMQQWGESTRLPQ